MTTINRFEDLKLWKDSRDLCRLIFEKTGKDSFSKDYDLVRQIRRSSGSAMDNIAEGFERRGNKEFAYFLSIVKGSFGEIQSQLYRAMERNYISKKDLGTGLESCIALSKQTSGLMNYLKTNTGSSRVSEPEQNTIFNLNFSIL